MCCCASDTPLWLIIGGPVVALLFLILVIWGTTKS